MVRKSIERSRVLVRDPEKNVLEVVPGRQSTVDTDRVQGHRLTGVPDTIPLHREIESLNIHLVKSQGLDHQTDSGEAGAGAEGDVLKLVGMSLLQEPTFKTEQMKDVRNGWIKSLVSQ